MYKVFYRTPDGGSMCRAFPDIDDVEACLRNLKREAVVRSGDEVVGGVEYRPTFFDDRRRKWWWWLEKDSHVC